MADIKKEFATFEEHLKTFTKATKVRDITRNFISDKAENSYGDYIIEHFLVLYKLSRMEELGIINEKIANDLREILDIKQRVNILSGEEFKKELYDPLYISPTLPKLHSMLETINNHLKKYHLTMDDISLTEMIEASIRTENNQLLKDDNNVRVKIID